jgi:hypothetical protein
MATQQQMDEVASMIAFVVKPVEGLRLTTGDVVEVDDLLERLNRYYHNDDAHHNGEGVLEHITDVYMSVVDETQGWPAERRGLLQLVALLHDLGKGYTYEFRKGRHTFYNHNKISREIAQAALYAGVEWPGVSGDVLDLVDFHDVFFQLVNQKKGAGTKYLKKFAQQPVSRGEQLENLVAFARADSRLAKSYAETLQNMEMVLNDLVAHRAQQAAKEAEEEEKQIRMLRNLELYWGEILDIVENAVPGAVIPDLDLKVVNRVLGQAKQYKALKAVKKILGRR